MSDSFLKRSFCVKSETVTVNISCHLTLKSMGLSGTLNWCCTHVRCHSIPWSLGKCCFTELWRSSTCCAYDTASRIKFVNITTDLMRKILSIGKLSNSQCQVTSFCGCSVAQSCPTLCDPMDCSTPGFSVLPQLPEFAQTHVHQVGDAIQPSRPLVSPSPPAFSLSQHQGLF